MSTERPRRITILSILSLSALASSLLLPRLFGKTGSGLADASSAALAYLMLFGLSSVLAVIVLIVTLKGWSSLPGRVRILGLAPSALVAVVGTIVILVLVAAMKR